MSRNESQDDMSRMRDTVGETMQSLEQSMLNPNEVLHKVQKLDEKMAAAAEIRESRILLANMNMNGAKALVDQYIVISDLMSMIKRMSICKCTLPEEQQMLYKIRLDSRALRIICHNFTTFARAKEDSASSYKAFATVDINLPLGDRRKKSRTKMQVRVKYMGQPLSDDEVKQAQDYADQFRTVKSLEAGDKDVSPANSVTPQSSFNSKAMWATMESGNSLAVAFQVGTLMGGSLAVEKEFRFSTISFRMETDIIGAGELTPESDGDAPRLFRKSLPKTSSRSPTPSRVQRDIDLKNSNNVSDIVKQFPEKLKIIVLSNDLTHSKKLLEDLDADTTSIALINNPENVDIIMDVCMGLIEVDPVDDRNVRRLKPLEAKMADVVIMNENIGSDTSGKRWLVTSLATALDMKGFKGIFALQIDTYDKQKIKGLQAAPCVNTVITKDDETTRVKVSIVLAFANPKEEKLKKKLSTLKRNNSYQRPKDPTASGSGEKHDADVVAHRLSERARRKSGSNINVNGRNGARTP